MIQWLRILRARMGEACALQKGCLIVIDCHESGLFKVSF